MKILALSLLLLFHICFADVNDKLKGAKVYRLTVRTEKQLEFLSRTEAEMETNLMTDQVNFWSEIPLSLPNPEDPILVMVLPGQQHQFLASLDAQAIPHEVTIPDVAKAIEEESQISVKDRKIVANGGMTWTAYHPYATIEAYLESLLTDYPELVREKRVIGKSYEGRDIHLLTVGVPRPDSTAKPAIWVDANIHAREWISSATVTYILNRLVTEYTSDPASKRMLDEIDWYFVPVHNVDGYAHTRNGNRLWRRTRSVNPFSPEFGADPNRNFDHEWMYEGADQYPGSDSYGGAYPYSEIEDLHVTEAMLALKEHIKAMLSFHSFSQVWLVPWAHGKGTGRPADYSEIVDLANKQVAALTAVHGTPYTVGTPIDTIRYRAAGGTLDFAKAKAGIKYVYTPELRDKGSHGFILPPDQIIPSGQETFQAVRVLTEFIHEKYGQV